MSAINLSIGERPRLEWLSKTLIRVDDAYQRPLKEKRVLQILRDFTWAQFGALMLVDQGDGTFTVYDGQHSLEAAKRHPEVDEVPVAIVVLDQAYEEAQSFLGVNINRSSISTVEKYWAGIEAGDEMMMRICSVLEEAGCEVVPARGMSPAPNRTNSISAIQRSIERYGEKATTQACATLIKAWPKDNSALAGVMIQALARLFRNNKHVIDADRMALKLHGKDRKILAADASAMQRIGGGDAAVSLAKALVETYNKGLQLNQIQIGAKV